MRLPTSRPAAFTATERRHRTSRTIEVRPGRVLGLGYEDQSVMELAARDGRSAFNTMRWGPGNRALHGLSAVLVTAATHAAAIRVKLEEALAGIVAAHGYARERFRVERTAAYAALVPVDQQVVRRRTLARKLEKHGLDAPTSRWPVMVFLGLLILGDLTMTSVAMAVLNLSDARYISWLPISELQLAAVPTVAGMFGAAHWLAESLKAHRCEPQLRTVLKIVAGASVAGGLCLAVSVAAIRTSYLNANGVPALPLAFIGLQLGLLAVAVAASTWTAHPYGPAWRQLERRERQADRRFERARSRAGQQAAAVNALAREFQGQVTAARAGVEAVLSDVARQGHLYIRELQHAQPEPTEEELYAGELPERDLPKSVQELLDCPDVAPGSSLAPPDLVDLGDLDEAWEELHQRRSTAVHRSDTDVDDEEAKAAALHPVAEETSPASGAA